MAGSAAGKAVRTRLAELWPLLQATAAATIAWLIATRVGDHGSPFFAPIAAVVALSFARGERGRSAVRLLLGVGIGIACGEVSVAVLGGGYLALAAATLAAVVIAHSMRGNRLVQNQAAAAAILTVAVADGNAGVDRLTDALIGAGVALLFSQVLFTPEPVALVRRAEVAVLRRLSDGLALTTESIDGGGELAARAAERLRDVGDELVELGRARRASARVVRHSLIWWSRSSPVVREQENAAHLDLLAGSCLMLARSTLAVPAPDRHVLAPATRQLTDVLRELAAGLGDRRVRQAAVDRTMRIVHELVPGEAPAGLALTAAVVGVRTVAYDVMVFAGADPDAALTAVEGGVAELRVVAPPPDVRLGRWITGSVRRRVRRIRRGRRR